MADELGDKTEAPTPRRRQEAREQGNIARSTDLTAAAVILGMLFMLQVKGGDLVNALRAVTEHVISREVLSDHDPRNISSLVVSLIGIIGPAMIPLLLGVALAAVLINLAQVGLVFNPKRLQPNLGALKPTKGLKRLFGKGKGSMQLVMNIAKLIVVSTVAYSAVHGRLEQIVLVAQLSVLQIFALASEIIFSIFLRLGVLLFVLAILDYFWQRYRTEHELKMTKQQVKDEMKKMEGDPLIKQRRRQIAMQRAMQRIKTAVPTADVIVTNPTEYAVALKYEDGFHAPRVVAKGRGYIAQKIRETAIEAGVPILERPPLARALWRLVEVGQEIPEQYYAAVAEILAYVYELSGKVKRAA
ncbi:MAG TPA: flagellar biosynthesis protein FlhB [Tepidisphaeraceae bacterium]|nr:flagellar biosynthesis protein FlhB [Tepidisphaeraceae bacterium]